MRHNFKEQLVNFSRESEKKISSALGGFLEKKNRGKKSCDTLPLISVTLVCTKTKRRLFLCSLYLFFIFWKRYKGENAEFSNIVYFSSRGQ